MQEAIVEQYNDQLRDLREAGLAEEFRDVRITLRELRDEERAAEGTKVNELDICWHCCCTPWLRPSRHGTGNIMLTMLKELIYHKT